jgi:uncharacterized protein (UPF0264 family)
MDEPELIAGTDIPKTGRIGRDRTISDLQMGANYLRMGLSDAAGCDASTYILETIVRAIQHVDTAKQMMTRGGQEALPGFSGLSTLGVMQGQDALGRR